MWLPNIINGRPLISKLHIIRGNICPPYIPSDVIWSGWRDYVIPSRRRDLLPAAECLLTSYPFIPPGTTVHFRTSPRARPSTSTRQSFSSLNELAVPRTYAQILCKPTLHAGWTAGPGADRLSDSISSELAVA